MSDLQNIFDEIERELEARPWYVKVWNWVTVILPDMRYDIPYGLKNFWRFRSVIWNFRSWDFHHNMMLLVRSIELTMDVNERDESRYEQCKRPRIDKMARFIELSKMIDNGGIIAEEEFGSELANSDDPELRKQFYTRWDVIENDAWCEMWDIIKGSGQANYTVEIEDLDMGGDPIGLVVGDGTDARGWWT
jgi:hypothetical protein